MYMCSDIPANLYSDVNIKIVSAGNWLACSDCEKVIDKKDLNELVKRYSGLFKRHIDVNEIGEEKANKVVKGIRDMYEVFLNNYSGKESYIK